MPSIAALGNATGTFGTQDSASIDAGGGYARFECPTGTIIAEFRGSRTFGPYDNASYRITSLQGALYYEIEDGTINYYSGGRDITSVVSGAGNGWLTRDYGKFNPQKAYGRVPPAWVTATTYKLGQYIKTAAGAWFVMSATTGVSGATEPLAGIYSDQVDGTCNWQWLGPAPIAADITGLPTITTQANGSTGVATKQVAANSTNVPAIFQSPNALYYTFSGLFVTARQTRPNFSVPSQESSADGTYIVETNSKYIVIDVNSFTTGLNVYFGTPGKPDTRVMVTAGMQVMPASGTGGSNVDRLILDRGSDDSDIELIIEGASAFAGIWVTPEAYVRRPGKPVRKLVSFGSSKVKTGALLNNGGRDNLMSKILGASFGVVSCGIGGSGFTVRGASGSTYSERVDLTPEFNTATVDAMFVECSGNDDPTAAGYQASVLAFFQKIRAAKPPVPIIATGQWSAPGNGTVNNTNVDLLNTLFKAALAQFNDSNTFFIPIHTDTPEGVNMETGTSWGGLLTFTSTTTSPATLGTQWAANGTPVSQGAVNLRFPDGTTRAGTLTRNSTSLSWTGGAVTAATRCSFDFVTKTGITDKTIADGTHCTFYGCNYEGSFQAAGLVRLIAP